MTAILKSVTPGLCHIRFFIPAVAFGVLLFAGCGGGEDVPPLGRVSGNVTSDGKLVTAGDVNFVSDAGFAASAPILEDGSYQIVTQYGTGLPVGEYLVSITPPPPPAATDPETPAPPPAPHPEIPERYRTIETSGLKVLVENGDLEFDIAMTPE